MQQELIVQMKQAQKLKMTSQLRQSIELLQLSNDELHDFLADLVVDNPVLALPEQQFFSQELTVDSIPESNNSLVQHCESQLCYFHLTKRQKWLCKYLIGCLDEKGYLPIDMKQEAVYLRVSTYELSECINIIKSLDPPGLGATCLTESIELQLQRHKASNTALVITREYLLDVAKGRLQKIAKRLKISMTEVQNAIMEIKACNPQPIGSFSTFCPSYISPDIIVMESKGKLLIDVPQKWPIPSVAQCTLHSANSEVAAYVQQQSTAITWVTLGLKRRWETLYSLAQAIVSKQQLFFCYGENFLRPLTQKEISIATGFHESTVSRAIQAKYMQTPWGLFPLKFFFPSSISVGSESFSSINIKARIKVIINNEEKRHPLSDQKITEVMQSYGICIARRTVAKYRAALGIPSTIERKSF